MRHPHEAIIDRGRGLNNRGRHRLVEFLGFEGSPPGPGDGGQLGFLVVVQRRDEFLQLPLSPGAPSRARRMT